MPRWSALVAAELIESFRSALPEGTTIAAVHVWGLDYVVEVNDTNAPPEVDGKILNPTFQRNYDTGAVTVLSYGESVQLPEPRRPVVTGGYRCADSPA